MANNLGNLALDGGDPRIEGVGEVEIATVVRRKMHDPNVPFEEYLYFAKIQREQEMNGLGPEERERMYREYLAGTDNVARKEIGDEKKALPEMGDEKIDPQAINESKPSSISKGQNDAYVGAGEWESASRAARNATWGAVVYLITTDILGPSNAPYSVSQFGYVGGVMMYFFMGIMAFFAGWQIWRMFLKLDSDRWPMRTFGDLGFRIFGTYARHAINLLQSIQLLFNVGVIVISNGQGLSEMSKYKLCFSICILVWVLAGMIFGQIRSLQKFGHMANFAIWLNILVILMTMGVAAHSPPNYAAALQSFGTPKGPIKHTIWIPSGATFDSQLSSAMQIVYAYGGAMLYCEFMAEMKRPLDFIKAQFLAEIFIFVCYLIFGCVVYSQQGQFTYNPANQGLSPYSWQTVTNALSLVSGLIAAVLYGNIGIKVIYQNIVEDLFNGPELNSKKGRIVWIVMVPLYWAFAFVVGSAVPQFTNISSLVAAVCIMQFTYTFPTLLYFGMTIKEDAIHPDETYDPVTGEVHRIDTWKDMSRWKRGLAPRWWLKIFCFLFFLASAATAILGMYSSIKSIIAGFALGHATSFGCVSPVGYA
ncbi:2f31d49e-6dae-40b9-937e-d27e55f8963a [Sclerotinia trifoliorum]|uniref:2f31d49e-6dae-40b9-937e-d27e55f8963a n=1 Tax=Sclerotinia trifoliorum TaxID=28548 RepID=A0A8H2W4H8_9HELO|nr:2f31d49e-6dae-40b9-937e-d27e55f8963a [Sclerotinia trifoliorum]